MRKFNKEEYLKLSKEERKDYKNDLDEAKHELNEIEWLEYEESRKEQEKETHCSIYSLDGFSFVNNVRNWVSLLVKPKKGFIVMLSEEKLSEIEEYGLEQLMINASEKYTDFDLLIVTFKGRYYKHTDHINSFKSVSDDNNEIQLTVNNVSQKCSFADELKDEMYAYCMYYEKSNNRNDKSFIWRVFHKRKQNILKAF